MLRYAIPPILRFEYDAVKELLRFALICYVLRYVFTFWEMLRFAALGTAKRNRRTAAKRKTMLFFDTPFKF